MIEASQSEDAVVAAGDCHLRGVLFRASVRHTAGAAFLPVPSFATLPRRGHAAGRPHASSAQGSRPTEGRAIGATPVSSSDGGTALRRRAAVFPDISWHAGEPSAPGCSILRRRRFPEFGRGSGGSSAEAQHWRAQLEAALHDFNRERANLQQQLRQLWQENSQMRQLLANRGIHLMQVPTNPNPS